MSASVVETHTSTLFFVDDLVYKRKRPLDLGFSDFRTLAARLAGCRDEVRLNRRLSPDVYLGVADVTGADGRLCDHLVVMRQMPDDRRLAALVAAGEDVDDILRRVAVQLANLHRSSPAPAQLRDLARADAVQQLWADGLDALRAFPDLVSEEVRERTRHLALRWLAGRGPLLDARVDEGRVYDGHGDLLADDIFALPDGPRILDCLEFSERLRICDGIADAAFLAMDLERLGAPAAARTFLQAYESAANDNPPGSLEDLYLAYRAHIRSKVSCIRGRQDPQPDVNTRARELAELALAHLQRGRVRLVLVGGLPGTGKTTIAEGLAAGAGWVHLSSDLTRKRLAGIDADQHHADSFRTGLYAPDMTTRTYNAMLTDARTALTMGESVVIDASLVDRRWREQARSLAHSAYADLVELQCTTPGEVSAARILQRTSTASDATPWIRRRLAVDADPWPEATIVKTTASIEDTHRSVAALVGAGPDVHEGQEGHLLQLLRPAWRAGLR